MREKKKTMKLLELFREPKFYGKPTKHKSKPVKSFWIFMLHGIILCRLFFFFSKCSHTMRTQPGHQYVQQVLIAWGAMYLARLFLTVQTAVTVRQRALQAACLNQRRKSFSSISVYGMTKPNTKEYSLVSRPPYELQLRTQIMRSGNQNSTVLVKRKRLSLLYLWSYIPGYWYRVETKKYKETNVIDIKYEGKVNEDAKNFGIKFKNGSLRMLTKKKNVLCLFGKISRFSTDPRRRGLGRRGTRMVITQ